MPTSHTKGERIIERTIRQVGRLVDAEMLWGISEEAEVAHRVAEALNVRFDGAKTDDRRTRGGKYLHEEHNNFISLHCLPPKS